MQLLSANEQSHTTLVLYKYSYVILLYDSLFQHIKLFNVLMLRVNFNIWSYFTYWNICNESVYMKLIDENEVVADDVIKLRVSEQYNL